MTLIVTDPRDVERMIAKRRESGEDRFDEVWEGVYVMSPLADDEHQEVQTNVAAAMLAIGRELGARVRGGVNVSDRDKEWRQNFRCPDVVVFLPGTSAVNRGSHWIGGPDFAVEILSPGDRTPEKLPFYASVNVRELLVVARQPWSLQLYRLRDGQLISPGPVAPGGEALTSDVLPVTFRLLSGSPRPTIEIVRQGGGETWSV